MKIVYIETEKLVEKSEEEIEREQKEKSNLFLIDKHKKVPLEEPIYIVEMSKEELQLVSFYLELEKRKPIMNVKLDVEKEKK